MHAQMPSLTCASAYMCVAPFEHERAMPVVWWWRTSAAQLCRHAICELQCHGGGPQYSDRTWWPAVQIPRYLRFRRSWVRFRVRFGETFVRDHLA